MRVMLKVVQNYCYQSSLNLFLALRSRMQKSDLKKLSLLVMRWMRSYPLLRKSWTESKRLALIYNCKLIRLISLWWVSEWHISCQNLMLCLQNQHMQLQQRFQEQSKRLRDVDEKWQVSVQQVKELSTHLQVWVPFHLACFPDKILLFLECQEGYRNLEGSARECVCAAGKDGARVQKFTQRLNTESSSHIRFFFYITVIIHSFSYSFILVPEMRSALQASQETLRSREEDLQELQVNNNKSSAS